MLFAQRDLLDARMVLIETKKQQLSAIVNAYQALGGGLVPFTYPTADNVQGAAIVPMPDGPADNPAPALAPPAGDKTDENK